MKYHIITYGCQMNLHESEKIAGILRSRGYTEEAALEEADIVVYNTCCIRENAENHALGNIGALKKIKRQRKDLIVAVGGCMAQEEGMAKKIRSTFPFVDIVFGTHNLPKLGEYIDEVKNRRKKYVLETLPERPEIEDGVSPVRTSYPNAWVNITYGCNNFCTYCIVPYVRGREKSRRAEDIFAEVRSLISEGYKEITLLGQNVNSYNSDKNGGMSFAELLDGIASMEGKFRLRFMTSHPKDFTEEVAAVMKKHDKICKCLHLPVQSGSNRILKLMNRRYTREKYLEEISLLRRYMPDCEVTTDLIVGFPTETEEEFEDTLRLVEEADFSSAFMFIFSPRTGTKAAEMEGQIPEDIQKERIYRLIELVNSKTREKSSKYVGKTVEILCEGFDDKKGLYLGRDEFGRMGYFESDKSRIGDFVNLKITRANGISLYGDPID